MEEDFAQGQEEGREESNEDEKTQDTHVGRLVCCLELSMTTWKLPSITPDTSTTVVAVTSSL